MSEPEYVTRLRIRIDRLADANERLGNRALELETELDRCRRRLTATRASRKRWRRLATDWKFQALGRNG